MKKVLYITNIEVPYRVRFFNELARFCDLTVLYERDKPSSRDSQWAQSERKNYRVKFLHGILIGGENAFSLGILKEIVKDYDCIVVGCYNSPVQMMAMLVMRLLQIPYMINLDGEAFLDGDNLKARLKRCFLSGAEKYLIAGEKSAQSLKNAIRSCEAVPYYFSSLSERELEEHRAVCRNARNKTILVVGQYFDYKGMDIALEAAGMDQSLQYKFVGMGARTELFREAHEIPGNVELVPFLQKYDLEREYQSCAMLVLPSRQECWGLVINEAASFGMPIVSTWGSGAAVELLADSYPQYLAKPGDADDLLRCIHELLASECNETYCEFLLKKSQEYHIERSVQMHLEAFR